jgi:hypothetical protein
MTPTPGQAGTLEYEIRGGAWEVVFVILFYAGVAIAIVATFGVEPVILAPIGIVLALLSVFAIASSPTYLLIEGCALVLERTRFYLGFSRPVPVSGVSGVRVTESRHSQAWKGGEAPDKDVSYFIRVDLLTGHGKVRAFRSPLNMPPGESRRQAMEMAERLSGITGKPVESVLK